MDLPEERIGFLSLELTKQQSNVKWRGSPFDEREEASGTHLLDVHSVIVGKNAVRGEENLVEVTLIEPNGDINETPLAYLTKGSCNQVAVNIRFPSGVKFTLAEGAGPIHILATHTIAPCVEDEIEEEELEEEDDDELNAFPPGENAMGKIEDELVAEIRKRKKFVKNGNAGKKLKLTSQETSDSEEEELNESAGDV